jgi:hypothetical protein
MSSNPNTEQSKTMDVQTAQRVEQERMTRRAALRKLGFGAGLAAFSMLGVDDMARMVGKRMERIAGDNKVANQVAKEFQQAGVAFADGGLSGSGGSGNSSCQHCANQYFLDNCYCSNEYGIMTNSYNPTLLHVCYNQADANNNGCKRNYCLSGEQNNNNGPYCPQGGTPPQGCSC